MMNQPSSGAEVTLYQDGTVVVTTGRFTVGPKMYPIRNLTSVEAAERHTPASRATAMFVLLGALASLMAVKESTTPVRPLLVFTLPLLALGIFLWRRAKPSSDWIVRVHTAGIQQDAVVTNDRARRDAILAALHRAYAG